MSIELRQPLFLGVETFELLVLRIPHEVLRGTDLPDFEEAIGTSRERFDFIVQALSGEGRTQCFVGPETAGYLRNALGVAILQFEDAEFKSRTGVDREGALEVFQQLGQYTEPATREAVSS